MASASLTAFCSCGTFSYALLPMTKAMRFAALAWEAARKAKLQTARKRRVPRQPHEWIATIEVLPAPLSLPKAMQPDRVRQGEVRRAAAIARCRSGPRSTQDRD